MIKIAKEAYGSVARFLNGNSSLLQTLCHFSIITSLMTLQFVEDIEQTLRDFSKALEPGGILVFAVHNPEYVNDCLAANYLFEAGMINLQGNKIPIFIRTAGQYNHMMKKLGCEPLLEAYPPFTDKFLTK